MLNDTEIIHIKSIYLCSTLAVFYLKIGRIIKTVDKMKQMSLADRHQYDSKSRSHTQIIAEDTKGQQI